MHTNIYKPHPNIAICKAGVCHIASCEEMAYARLSFVVKSIQ